MTLRTLAVGDPHTNWQSNTVSHSLLWVLVYSPKLLLAHRLTLHWPQIDCIHSLFVGSLIDGHQLYDSYLSLRIYFTIYSTTFRSLTPPFSLITLMWLLFCCPWVLLSTHMHIYSKGGREVKECAVYSVGWKTLLCIYLHPKHKQKEHWLCSRRPTLCQYIRSSSSRPSHLLGKSFISSVHLHFFIYYWYYDEFSITHLITNSIHL